MSTDLTEEEVAAERERQIEKGYTPDHDRKHGIAHVLRYARTFGMRGEQRKCVAMIDAALEIAPFRENRSPLMSSVDEERTALIAKAVNLTRRAQTLLTLHEESGIAYVLDARGNVAINEKVGWKRNGWGFFPNLPATVLWSPAPEGKSE